MNIEEAREVARKEAAPRVALILTYLYKVKDVEPNEDMERIITDMLETAVMAGMVANTETVTAMVRDVLDA